MIARLALCLAALAIGGAGGFLALMLGFAP